MLNVAICDDEMDEIERLEGILETISIQHGIHVEMEDFTSGEKLLKQMPTITPHVCRHTFCSNMAKSGMNPKALQYIMGHSEIGVTLNTYTHVKFEDAEEEMKRIASW